MVARPLRRGAGWSVSEYICSAGPADRPFEERHGHITIAAVLEGTFNYRADTGNALLYPGSFLLGNIGTCYQCGHDHSTGDRCVALHLTPDYFGDVAASVSRFGRFRFPTAMLPAIAKLLPWAATFETRAAADDPLAIDETVLHLVETVIATICGSSATAGRYSARDAQRISDVVSFVEQDPTEPIDLAALAGLAGMSKYHFLRMFRRMTGMTPYQYLLGVRLRRAAMRLATTREPVSAIAFDSGFGDLSTFNARFRTTFGVSPTEYRRRQ